MKWLYIAFWLLFLSCEEKNETNECNYKNPIEELRWLNELIDDYDRLYGDNGISTIADPPDYFSKLYSHEQDTLISYGDENNFKLYNCSGTIVCHVIDGNKNEDSCFGISLDNLIGIRTLWESTNN